MAVILVEGFEHDMPTATGYNTNDQRVPLWNAYTFAGLASITKTTTITAGSWSEAAYRINEDLTNATSVTLTNTAGDLIGNTRIVGTFRFQFPSVLPSTNQDMFYFGMATGSAARISFNTTTDKLAVGFGGAETVDCSATLSADTWYWVDFDWNGSGNPHTFKARVNNDTGNENTSSLAQASDTNTNVRIGSTVAAQDGEWVIDDLVLTNTGTDYPLGAVKVYGLAPSSNGTHVNSGNFAQTGGTGGSWWTAMDSWGSGGGSLSSAEYIEQNVNGSGDYIEVGFESLPSLGSDAVLGISFAFTTWASTTGANGAIIWGYDGTTATTMFTGDNSDTSPRYQRWYALPAPGGGWSESIANAMKYRVGGATLIPGNPRFGATIMQVAVYTPPAAPGADPFPFVGGGYYPTEG